MEMPERWAKMLIVKQATFGIDRFSPEFQLACACCRVRPSAWDREAIRRLLPQIDVLTFTDLVLVRHRIGPLVHHALKQCAEDLAPPGLMKSLADEARINSMKALRAVRSHVLLQRWFEAAAIDWLPFKGTTVALRYYGDVSLRHVNDLDLWVPLRQLERAREVLAGQGFRWDARETGWDLAGRGPRHRDYLVRYHYEETHFSREHGSIEVHWQLTDNRYQFDIAPNQLLARAEKLQIGGGRVPVMNSVDLLLYLCEHGCRHGWYRLKWLADLPQILESHEWDWDAVFTRATQAGCRRSLLLAMYLAQELFHWTPPAAIAGCLQRRHSLALLGAIVRVGLLAPQQWWSVKYGLPLRWHLRLIAIRVLLLGRWRALGVIAWRYSLSPNDLRVTRLPDSLFFLYRLLRPLLHGLRRFGASAPKR